MSEDIRFRSEAVKKVVAQVGIYALCDLDGVPIYVGQSVDGIRARVRRHLTSARSDIIANRQIDVWEIAWVMAWPVESVEHITPLEAALFHHYDAISPLMNGTVPRRPFIVDAPPPAFQTVQLISSEQIERRRDPVQRLPRQIEHYGQIVSHFLVVKDSAQIQRSMRAHFDRLARYHELLMSKVGTVERTTE